MPRSNVRVALTGDSLITRGLARDSDSQTAALYRLIQESDVGFTNLETVPNNFAGYPVEESGGAHLGAHEYVLDELDAAGFNLLAAANNHSLNYGVTGLLTLIDILETRGVAFAGIGRNLAGARAPVYLDTDSGSVALIACASTFARGQQASEQRPDMPGRPGLNPLRFSTTYRVTSEQLVVLRTIAEHLGLEAQRLERIEMGFGFPPDDPDVFPFLNGNFVEAFRPSVETRANDVDLDAIAGWVREARDRADVVLVSLHAHERGDERETPADFIRDFAHRMIDEGAHAVVGHGPHLLRGMEMRDGCPIFYSLGNFIGQNELTYKLPSDSYETFRVDPALHPGELFRQRSQDGRKGFPSDIRYWQSVLPVCRWQDGALVELDLYPVTLRLGPEPRWRGRPALAEGEEGIEILDRFAGLSRAFGTSLVLEAGKATLPGTGAGTSG